MGKNCNGSIEPAVITPVLAAGATASPYFVQVKMVQRLCCQTCAADVPVFAPRFSVKGVRQVGAGQHVVTVHVEGIISYVKCGGGCSCTRQQPLSQDFTVPVSGAVAAVALEAGVTENRVSVSGCQTCGRVLVSETPLTLTVS